MDCCENPMGTDHVVCPKPRRVSSFNFNNSMTPSRFYIRSSNGDEAFDSKPGAGLLDLTLCKEGFEAKGCANVSSSPPFSFGSPPCRAQNPLAQDAYFRHQKLGPSVSSPSDSASLPSPHSRKKFGNKQVAVIRVEGFDCQSSRVVAMA